MLFSEPKIPQSNRLLIHAALGISFSALQRAENSSKLQRAGFSREQARFSALQRAENSSNDIETQPLFHYPSFSALQRAENSSKDLIRPLGYELLVVSVLFSEPKIPQIGISQ